MNRRQANPLPQGKRGTQRTAERSSRAQFAQEFLLIHVVLKSFATVDEDDGDFVCIEAANFGVGVDVNFSPGEAATLVELDDALLDDFAEMTSLAGINEDFPRRRHARECSSLGAGFQQRRGVESRDEDARDEDERTATFWEDDAGDGSGEAAGARDCFGRGRKRRGRGDYLSRVGARGAGGGGRVSAAWRGGAGGAV